MFTQSSLGNSQFWERNWSISKDLAYKIAISILVSDRGVKTDTSFICRKRALLDTFSRSGNDFDRFYFIYVHMQSPTSGRVPLSKMIGYH